MLGRILSGIATSLLFSSFESWMISEHTSSGYSPSLLGDTFSLATFGNGIVAIGAGLIASWVADVFGYVAPFMVSLGFLILGSVIVSFTWKENYGDATIDLSGTFGNAITTMRNDIKIPILGMVQSLFEAAMYTFVFMWTPALQVDGEAALPFGLIFASYMVSIMIGSTIFGIVMSKLHISPEDICRILLVLATISLAVPIWIKNREIVMFAFLVFELCCGIYFPCLGTLRGKYIPEKSRSAVMNFFRVPLNFLVVVVLMKVGSMDNSTVFLLCTIWLGSAFLLQSLLRGMAAPSHHSSSTSPINSH
jgi:MFS family permease